VARMTDTRKWSRIRAVELRAKSRDRKASNVKVVLIFCAM
jgi:hypothetical protein